MRDYYMYSGCLRVEASLGGGGGCPKLGFQHRNIASLTDVLQVSAGDMVLEPGRPCWCCNDALDPRLRPPLSWW